jgi:SAM-dependent methyltransferase
MTKCTLCDGTQLNILKSNFDKIFFECELCGLIFTDPSTRPDSALEIERYNLHKNDPNDPNYRKFLSKVTTPLLSYLTKDMIGLDYGCGPGPAIDKIFAEHGIAVKNYDPYFAPLEFTESQQFDFIVSTETIEHFYNPQKDFNKISKLIRPGGYLAVMTEVFDNTIPFDSWWYAKEPTHVSLYQPKTFEWIAKYYNWTILVPSENVRIFTI